MASATALTTEAASTPVHAQNHQWPSNMSTLQAWHHLSVDSPMMGLKLPASLGQHDLGLKLPAADRRKQWCIALLSSPANLGSNNLWLEWPVAMN